MLEPSLILALAVQLNAADADGPSRTARGPGVSPDPTPDHYDGSAREIDVPVARLTEGTVVIDGVLDDDAWAEATVLGGFTQYEPVEGVAASESTVARVLVGDDAVYFAVRAEAARGGVRATMTERDGFGRSDDYVRFILDTFNDDRRAYVFMVNPYGIQGDGLWVEGSGGGRGGGDPIDWSPEFVWESAGRLDDRGYSAELKIPLKSLRFPDSEVQDWGLQVVRSIQRTGYQESWAPISRERANRLEQSGTLRGLRGLDAGLFLEINPTATGSLQGTVDEATGRLAHGAVESDFGVNLTYGLTSNLTLDGTVNPDFSQIEADAGQIAVNERFALFLPERRPFFLEGTDVFAMPEQLVYTRSIANPVGAAKLSGKVGDFQVAYLGAVDDVGTGGDDPIVNLLRFRRDVGASSSVGMVYTDRTRPGTDFNRVAGADARLVLGGRYTLSLMAAGSADGGADAGTTWGSLLSASVRRTGRSLTWNASFEDVAEDFRAGSGFIRRTGISQLRSRVGYTFRGGRGALVESWGPSLEANGTWSRPDFWSGRGPQESELGLNLSASFRNNVGGFVSLKRESFDFGPESYEGYVSGDLGDATVRPLSRAPELFDGLYSLSLRSWLSSWERARLSLGGGWGQTPIFAGQLPVDAGESWNGSVDLTLYPTGSLQAELGVRHVTILRRRDGSRYSSATIPRAQLRYQFSRALFVRGIGEYSSQERGDVLDPRTGTPVQLCKESCRALTGSIRNDFRIEGLVGYEPSPGTVVFVGYTRDFRDTTAFGFRDVRPQADGLFVKLSYRMRM